VIVRLFLQEFLIVCVLVSQAQIDVRVAAEFLNSFKLALQCWADFFRGFGNVETFDALHELTSAAPRRV
jgi:hypothetical protein